MRTFVLSLARLLACLLTATLALVVVPPAVAADTTVHVDVDVAEAVELGDCDLSVPSGSNGLAVLDGAVAAGCIESYETQTHPQFGAFVRCINDICAAPDETFNITYWALYVDGRYATLGVSALTFPDHGSTLGFNYETWATGLVTPPAA